MLGFSNLILNYFDFKNSRVLLMYYCCFSQLINPIREGKEIFLKYNLTKNYFLNLQNYYSFFLHFYSFYSFQNK